jgi:hypothetical protein
MSDESKTTTKAKQKRTRSPAYPAIDLQTALGRAAALWSKINRHAAPLDAIAGYWGYDPKSSKAMSEAAALIKYGLLSDEGMGSKRTIKLTESGIKLSYNPDMNSSEYLEGLKKAALSPSIHQELWERYVGSLPDDAVIKRYLVVDKKFNEQYVDEFISQFRRTIEFSKLASGDTITQENAVDEPNMISTPPTTHAVRSTEPLGQFVHPKPRNQMPDTFASPIIKPNDLALPLESGETVIIPKMTEDDYNLFLETLQLWKRRIIIKPQAQESSEPEKI